MQQVDLTFTAIASLWTALVVSHSFTQSVTSPLVNGTLELH